MKWDTKLSERITTKEIKLLTAFDDEDSFIEPVHKILSKFKC